VGPESVEERSLDCLGLWKLKKSTLKYFESISKLQDPKQKKGDPTQENIHTIFVFLVNFINFRHFLTPGGHLGHFLSKVCSKTFPKVCFLQILRHFGHLWEALGTHLAPLWATLGAKSSIWETFGPHLTPFGWLGATSENCNIAIFSWEYCNLDHFEGPWATIFAQNCNKISHVSALAHFFDICVPLLQQREQLRTTFDHFFSKNDSKCQGAFL